jgi:hypothetical protein
MHFLFPLSGVVGHPVMAKIILLGLNLVTLVWSLTPLSLALELKTSSHIMLHPVEPIVTLPKTGTDKLSRGKK